MSELLRASAKLQPAFHAYEQAARHQGLDWRELVDIVNRVVDTERRQRLDNLAHQPAKNGQPRVKPQIQYAAPAIVPAGPYKEIVERCPNYCWRRLHGKCSFGARCRFSHENLPPSDACLLVAA